MFFIYLEPQCLSRIRMLVHPNFPNILNTVIIHINQRIIGHCTRVNDSSPAQDTIKAILLSKIPERFIIDANKALPALIEPLCDG